MVSAGLPLFDYQPTVAPVVESSDPAVRFAEFHAANPHVYRHLVRYAREAKANGRRVGMRLLWERIRWDAIMVAGDEFKMNNNLAPYYSRLIMECEPDLAGYFETRGRL